MVETCELQVESVKEGAGQKITIPPFLIKILTRMTEPAVLE